VSESVAVFVFVFGSGQRGRMSRHR
jgi:hypothetical protein